jgi:tripartite-type tricarboxylate transporter receptor subunit TctC
MMKHGLVFETLAAAIALVVSGPAWTQTYPTKPLRIVTLGSGTTNDFMARLIAQPVSNSLGQQIIVENRAGSAIIPGQIVSKAAPDGYTLLYTAASTWLVTLLQKDVPYDPFKDFAPVTLTSRGINVLVVHPSLPVKSVKELIALAKAKPGQLNFSTGATGGSTQLAAELFKSMAGVNMVRVIYTSGSTEVSELLSGQVQLTFGAGSLMPYVKAGRLRALAVSSAQASSLFPGLPPISASIPGYESVGYFGMFAPPQTPAAIVSRVNQEVVRALKQPDVRDGFLNSGFEIIGSTPEEFTATIKSEMAKWAKVFKEAGIQPN